jgi:hypothetical protein
LKIESDRFIYPSATPICFPLRQMAWQDKGEPLAVTVKYFGNSGRPVRPRHAPAADRLRTMQPIVLLLNAIVAGVVAAYRGRIRRSWTDARSAIRASTMLKTPAHRGQPKDHIS